MTTLDPVKLPRATRAAEPALLAWCGVLLFAVACLALADRLPWLTAFPRDWVLPVAAWLNAIADVVVPVVQPLFRAIADVLDWPMRGVRQGLLWLPWPAIFLVVAALALKAGGGRLALFSVLALGYMLLTGYWSEGMSTLSLVILAVPIATAAGFALGILGYRCPGIRPALLALLDLMQTMPAFAYLIPLLLLFGFGPVVGLIASSIFATPPMVRNTMLGLDRVADAIREAGLMSGCTRRQLFWQVEVPTALPQLLVGFNQTTMATLAMVIIAAIIGGFQDIGWEVLSSMRRAEFGHSMMAGLVIAFLAILIDRTTLGFARARAGGPTRAMAWMTRRRLISAFCLAAAMTIMIRLTLPAGTLLPESGLQLYATAIDRWLLGLVRDYGWFFNGIRDAVLYSVTLPLRIGIVRAASPYVWGFELTPALIAAYSAGVVLLAALLAWRLGWRPAVAALLAGLFLYFGFAGFPWPVFIAAAALLAWQVAGPRLALFAAMGFGLILLTGLWTPLGQSLYLTAIAVVTCLIIGGALGVWAAVSDRVSNLIRPICDALQTMPQFVFLIPALMLFKVGEFTALIAIVLYAVVPPIRYVEHGLRHVPADVIEATRQMGATPRQILFQAKLPLALPVVMLGVNQTIMYALSMLVIAALVGTRDLGQQVYIALGQADAGMGLITGLSIVFLAILSDRLVQAWVARRTVAA